MLTPAPSRSSTLLHVLQLQLPLVVMAAMALGTFALVRNTPEREAAPPPKATPKHIPNQILNGFVAQQFNPTGALTSELRGQQMRRYPDDETTEIDQPLRWEHTAKSQTRYSADKSRSNSDSSEVQLIGQVWVAQTSAAASPGASGGVSGDASGAKLAAAQYAETTELRSDFFHLYTQQNRITTPLAFELRKGKDKLSGVGLQYDGNDGKGVVGALGQGQRVRMTLAGTR